MSPADLPVRVCLLLDPGCANPLGIGRTFAEARANMTEQLAAHPDPLDPVTATEAYWREQVDAAEPAEVRAPSLRALRTVLVGLGCERSMLPPWVLA